MKLRMKNFAFLMSTVVLAEFSLAQTAAPATTQIGTIDVQGQPGGTDSGLIQQEDAAKARSSVNKAHIEKQAPTATAFQAVQLLPGVSTFDQDGTGLFGGTLRMRGFNSNQIGITLDGAPLNDSLNYSIFIQEFADPENLCDAFVTQGSSDLDGPHVGASGGNIGISTCDPKDQFGGKAAFSAGSNQYRKTFVRLDSGKFMNDRAKLFLSLSKAGADKFKGEGSADRQHLDGKLVFNFDKGSYSKLALLYNRMDNANYRTLSKAELAGRGYNLDFGNRAPVHQTPVAGTAQNDATFAPNAGIFSPAAGLPPGSTADSYAGFQNNPFENYQVSMVNHWQISPKASVQVNPYYIYGYGFGGPQLTTLAESSGGGRLHGGIRDLNGDGDTLDTVAVYGSNTSRTDRWGVTAKVNVQVENHNLMAGLWQDKGESKQFGPFVGIDGAGGVGDYWLKDSNARVLYQDGTPVTSRNWLTNVTARTYFLQDSFNVLGDKLNLQLGLKHQAVKRHFNNFANGTAAGTNAGGADYRLDTEYSNTLANFGAKYQLNERSSTFFNAGQNARAPENNANTQLLQTTGSNYTTTVVNGAMVARDSQGNAIPLQLLPLKVKPEKSSNFDLGYRYAGDTFTFSGSVFYVDYKDRIASQFNPVTGQTTSFNVGDVATKGFELESGVKLGASWTAYGSLTYTKSTMQDDKLLVRTTAAGGSTLLPTTGKQMPDTPNWLTGLSLQYSSGGFFGGVQGRYVGSRYTTLVNDDKVGGYTLVDMSAGYKFQAVGFAKSPVLRLNVANLFSKQYLSMTGPSGSSFATNVSPVATSGGTVAGNQAGGQPTTPQFYTGAPRSIQVTFSSDF
jgi:iron complex outermembrane recepter protein